jgi:hypothetical protein
MNRVLCLILIPVAALIAVACSSVSLAQSPNQTPIALPPLPRSMKGYELYSWQTDGKWSFALMTGTNRLKSVAEITTGTDTVDDWVRLSANSIEEIKQHLRRLPRNEDVFWIGKQTREKFQVPAGPLDLPPAEIVDAIKEYCKELGLNLYTPL